MRKLNYYLANGLKTILPPLWLQGAARKLMRSDYDKQYINQRVSYYNKLNHDFELDTPRATAVKDFKKTGGTTYYFDLYKIVKCFNPEFKFHYLNGDVVDVPDVPSFLKSRPIDISEKNANSVVLKLNAIRHYLFVNDTLNYRDKQDVLIWRGSGFRPNRRLLLEKFFYHPRCNVGRTDKKESAHLHFVVPRMSIKEQLKYKFILSLEGKDVATNLKWIMSSNSLCFTPKLRFETWFMEGLLEPGVHYVEVADDFSDLIEKMDYYLAHPKEAETIISNANQWVAQFKNPKQEHLIGLLVAEKYFRQSGQLSED